MAAEKSNPPAVTYPPPRARACSPQTLTPRRSPLASTSTSCCAPGVSVPAGCATSLPDAAATQAQAPRPVSQTNASPLSLNVPTPAAAHLGYASLQACARSGHKHTARCHIPPPLHAQCTDPMNNHGTMTEPHPEARLSTTGTSCCAPGVCVPAGLCKVPARCDAQLERQVLQEHCQHVADQDDKQQAVAKLCTTCQACGPVTRVPTAERPGNSRDGDAKRWQRVSDVVVLLPAGALPPETNTMTLLRVSCGGTRSCGKR